MGRKRHPLQWSDDELAELEWLWFEGVLSKEIGRLKNLCQATISIRARKAGLPSRRSWRREMKDQKVIRLIPPDDCRPDRG